MTEQTLGYFINSLKLFFAEITEEEPEMGVPFVEQDRGKVLKDYTSSISITGDCSGAVYVSMQKDMLTEIAKIMLEEQEVEEDTLGDVVGELANTIAGHGCQQLVEDYSLSVPMVITGKNHVIKLHRLNSPIYVIPFEWHSFTSYLFVGLDID